MLIIRVSKIKGYREGTYDNYDRDDGEDFGQSVGDPDRPEETTQVAINADTIRTYYPRKNGRVGTRINFSAGRGFAIKETVAELEALLADGGVRFAGEYLPVQTPLISEATATEGAA